MSYSNDLKNWFSNNRGKGIGIIAGALFGIVFLFGILWQLLFIIALMAAGYIIGRAFDEKLSIPDVIRKIFRR